MFLRRTLCFRFSHGMFINGSREKAFSFSFRKFSSFEKLNRSDEVLFLRKLDKCNNLVKEGYELKIGIWLSTCGLLILGMVCLGGYTRLTESGLSMVDWKFRGMKYPRSEEEWKKEFDKYKLTPEYEQVHYNISLEEYKRLYFIEWFHRMFGRGIGLFFLSGVSFFLYKKILKKYMIKRICVMLSLGTFQGYVGWWMVKSGFSIPDTENKTPRVSPYRLVFHLFCATVTYSYVFWNSITLTELGRLRRQFKKSKFSNWNDFLKNHVLHEVYEKRNIPIMMKLSLFVFTALLFSNIMYGGFVAGNDAGYAYNTWPKMLDKYIPDEVQQFYLEKKKIYKKLFENTAIVQFNHRVLSYLLVLQSFLMYNYSKKLNISKKTKRFFLILPVITTTQMLTGISVLIHNIPIPLALTHQFGGFCVLTVLLHLLKTCRV